MINSSYVLQKYIEQRKHASLFLIINWRGMRASETLSDLTNGMYIFIYCYVQLYVLLVLETSFHMHVIYIYIIVLEVKF